MSDFGRKDFGDKVSETIKPDSEKSYLDKAKESATDAYDNVAGKLQPNENKSVGQTAGDVFSGAKDDSSKATSKVGSDAKDSGESYLDKAKDLASNAQESTGEYAKSALNSAGEYINSASEYVQGKK